MEELAIIVEPIPDTSNYRANGTTFHQWRNVPKVYALDPDCSDREILYMLESDNGHVKMRPMSLEEQQWELYGASWYMTPAEG